MEFQLIDPVWGQILNNRDFQTVSATGKKVVQISLASLKNQHDLKILNF